MKIRVLVVALPMVGEVVWGGGTAALFPKI